MVIMAKTGVMDVLMCCFCCHGRCMAVMFKVIGGKVVRVQRRANCNRSGGEFINGVEDNLYMQRRCT